MLFPCLLNLFWGGGGILPHQVESGDPEVGCAHKRKESQPEEPRLQLGGPRDAGAQQRGKGLAEQHGLRADGPAEERECDREELDKLVVHRLPAHPPALVASLRACTSKAAVLNPYGCTVADYMLVNAE